MVGYYLNAGDEHVSNMFTPYVWKQYGFGELVDKAIAAKDYGEDLKLLLIQYYVEGKFSSYLPEEPKVGNYSNKNKDIAVAIGVPVKKFHNCNEFERREFIVDSTLDAIIGVKEKLAKKKLDVDFDALINDIKQISEKFLTKEGAYSDK